MLQFLDFLRPDTLTWLPVTVRLVLAFICGGIIGIEREHKRRPAGFRTHILICIGAAVTTLTSQYILLNIGMNTDPARLGAQVIAGIGFIGTGTIIVTRRRQIKGLTTAAGLWVSAIVGLACGAGYYEAAVVTTVLVLIAEIVLARIEYSLGSMSKDMNLYVEYADNKDLSDIVTNIRQMGLYINDLEMTRSSRGESDNPCAIFSLQVSYKCKLKHEEIMERISAISGVCSVEEL